MIETYKQNIKHIVEQDELFSVDPITILNKIEKTATKEDVVQFYGVNHSFPANADGNWEYKKEEVSPELWRAVYKYSDEYGSYPHSTYSYLNEWLNTDLNILDFGCGPNPNIPRQFGCNLYLVELNDKSRELITQNYRFKNVYCFENLSDVFKLDIKFDVIFTKDVIEHVRYVNEHLYVLYLLCKEDGLFYVHYPYGDHQGNHVSTLYNDTIIRDPYRAMGN